jgi:hypothetical protein
MPLSRDLLGLPEKVLLELQDALANAGYVDPFPTACTEAAATVTRYTSAYTLAAADLQRLERPLVIYDLYSHLGTVPEAVKDAYEKTMAELRDIRDGKFPGLEAADEESSGSTGAWGSRTKLTFPGDTTE